MKTITLAKSGALKLRSGDRELFNKDCASLSKSYLPGEWIQLYDEKGKVFYLATINLNADRSRPIIYVLQKLEMSYTTDEDEFSLGEKYLKTHLAKAIMRRERYKSYEGLGRMVYGEADDLAGLTVDKYLNAVLVEIHTAGMDRYRDLIRKQVQEICSPTPVFILDRPEARALEKLPLYENEMPLQELVIKENRFEFKIPSGRMQKIGYYYDHREGRLKFERLIQEQRMPLHKGLDLFCYVGSWGLHQLRAGVEHVTFVDQGDFAQVINGNLSMNHLAGRGDFLKRDVFSHLDELIKQREEFDVITSDPPAFAKSVQNKQAALNGYTKLHGKILKLIKDQGLLAINSCTQYVSFVELDATVQEAAHKVGRKVFLMDMGLQGWDHPMRGLQDKGHYLKYLAYRVES